MHERTNIVTMKKRLYAYRKTPNECNSEKIKQNIYENHEIEDRAGTAEKKIEDRSAKRKQTMHIVGLIKYTWSLEVCEQKQLLTHSGVASKTTMNTMRINNTRTMDPKAEANTFKRIYPVTRRSTPFQNASARTRRRHVWGFD
jgi:hypothetical protein